LPRAASPQLPQTARIRASGCELIQAVLPANVARVQNQVAAGKQIDQLAIEKTVRVGDDAHLQR